MSIQRSIASQLNDKPNLQVATFGGGCFWCTEATFAMLKGVVDVESAYAGSDFTPVTYELVCTGRTGLAEVIQVLFDPAMISYTELLQVFFAVHNPTTLNQQGADKGTQYRSVIFTHSDEQAAQAQAILPLVENDWGAPVVTEITTINHYTRAEDYHQEYFAQNPHQGYCQAVIPPKMAKLRANFSKLLK